MPDAKVDFDELLGTPNWIASTEGFLTGQNGLGRAVSAVALAGIPANDPDRAAKGFLRQHTALFGHGPEVLTGARVKREFVTAHNGLRTVVWEQQVDGIAVFESLLIAHTTKQGELVNLSSRFVPTPDQAASSGTPGRAALQSNPIVSAAQALILAAQNIGDSFTEAETSARAAAQGADQHQTFTAALLKGEADVRLVWLPIDRSNLRLCWDVILMSRARGEMFRVLVDARTGACLLRRCLTENITNATYRVFTTVSPTPLWPGYSTPSTNQPSAVARVLVVTNAFNTNASPNGWIEDTNNETLGNNVDAHLDRDADNLPDLPRPRGSPFRVFDFPLDLAQDPLNYGDACVVNLFYWANWMHDKLYQLGFTEAAGNYQVNNFGKGGLGNDPVLVDAQDGSGYNNANFSTPPDGSPGRMQMYLWNGPTPYRDGAYDTEVILHEYTHGLSNRRVGGGVGISALQSRGLGEGWSDFYSLALLSQSGDDVNAVYPEGPYVAYLYSGLTTNYYFGIRRYPYCTDTNKSPLTFKDLDPAQASAHTGIPKNGSAPASETEIHNQGEIWCVALWDARANLINKYGFTVGNQLILQLVTDGMNLTPANPTFIQARDGILQADLVDNGAVNHHELWLAFAKRGMGYSATAPVSSTTSGLVEAFNLPDYLLVTPPSDFVSEGSISGPFNPPLQTFVLHNISTSNLNWSAGVSVAWASLSLASGTLPGTGGATNVAVSLNSNANSLPIGDYSGTVSFTNLTTGSNQTRGISLSVAPPRIYSFFLTNDPGWSRQGEWAFGQPSGQGGTAHGHADPTVGATGTNVFGVNLSGDYSIAVGGPYYLTVGPLDFTGSANVLLQFQRWLNTDYTPYTYATIEVSTNGSNWTLIFENDSGEIADAAWTKLQYNLAPFADNHTAVYVRWGYQVGQGAFAYSGWNLDDIQFLGMSEVLVSLPASATEGQGLLAGQGQVSLRHAPASDLVVNLVSSNTSKVTVPSTVTILAGQTNAAFNLTILDNGILDATVAVNVAASAAGYSTGVATIAIYDNETATLGLSLPGDATEGDGSVSGTVSISSVPAADILVSLVSSNPASFQVPATVTIPSGQTNAMFNGAVVNDTLINGTRPVTVVAHVANWTDGSTVINIHDNETTNLTVTLPAQARESNGTLTNSGSVSISGTLPTNLVVSLASSNINKVTVPPTATILAGQTSAKFNLTLVSGNLPHSPQLISVGGSAAGFMSGSSAIYVIDNETPPAPINPRPPHLSTTNPIAVILAWNPGPGEGVEKLNNGGFETGNLSGWTLPLGTNNAGFIINDGSYNPLSSDSPTPPFAGSFSGLADAFPPALSVLCQDVALPPGPATVMLSWVDRIRTSALGPGANQQFRVEIRNTNNVTLAVVFATQPGDTLLADWVQRSASLSGFAGQTVRIAFIVSSSTDFLDVHLDEISLRCSTLPPANYDVYFGTNATPGVPELLGTTSNTFWTLPPLTPFITYYWQVVARRLNDTPGPVWQFSSLPTLFITNLFLVEGDSGTTNAVFNVTLSPTNNQTVTVNFATANNTAVAPGDYAATNGTLTFNPGETNHPIVVAANGNTNSQPNRAFWVNFSNVMNAALVLDHVSGLIVDDDSPPVIESIAVAAGQATLSWSAVPGRSYRVQYKTNFTDMWSDLSGDVPATAPSASKVDASGLVTKRFYRVKLLP